MKPSKRVCRCEHCRKIKALAEIMRNLIVWIGASANSPLSVYECHRLVDRTLTEVDGKKIKEVRNG